MNAIENEEHLLFTCPLYMDIQEKLLNGTSQNAVTDSLQNFLSLKSETNMFRSAKVLFQCNSERKEFTGFDQFYGVALSMLHGKTSLTL